MILGLAMLPSFSVSAGSFAALVAAMFSLLRPVRRITEINNTIQKGVAGAQSIFELLDIEPEKDTGILPLIRAKGIIEFRVGRLYLSPIRKEDTDSYQSSY